MDLHAGIRKALLASCFALGGAGCAISATPARNDAGARTAGAVADASSTRSGDAFATADAFEGDWYYGSDCDFGHYVVLGLKRSGDGYEGQWSDGTRVRGSQGNLKASLRNGELIMQRCDDGTDIGGAPDCPAFGAPHDVFVRSGESLMWLHAYGGDRQRYVTLHRADQKTEPTAGCRDPDDEVTE